MSELWSFGSAVALWIGISCSLWWLHRRRVHGRQDRQLELARRAAARAADARGVFDNIRTPVPLDDPPSDSADWLRAEAHALLKRIQEQGSFFDEVTTLRVELQAAAGAEEHESLGEILQLRRDLWAASEIVLIEDPASFGATFAEGGAYERFRTEALQLLFKREEPAADDEAPIELRLGLAQEDAQRFVAELEASIKEARERDRLPTLAELLAYPMAFFRAIPGYLRSLYRFARAFLAHAAELAQAIRDSETMERSTARLRQARADWPQQLSSGFERASATAKGGAASLRRHYDFLVAAYDFQSKYEAVLQRAPEITERGRQFLERLELAERSERLRLTSTNATIWAARRMVDGLARAIAGLQRLYAAASQTGGWALAAKLLAPAPDTGRRVAAFSSYQRALAANGLSELPELRPTEPAAAAQPVSRRRAMKAQQKQTQEAQRSKKPKANGKPSAAEKAVSSTADKPAAKRGKENDTKKAASSKRKPKGKVDVAAQPTDKGNLSVKPEAQSEAKRPSTFALFRRRERAIATTGTAELAAATRTDAPKSKAGRTKAQAAGAKLESAAVAQTGATAQESSRSLEKRRRAGLSLFRRSSRAPVMQANAKEAMIADPDAGNGKPGKKASQSGKAKASVDAGPAKTATERDMSGRKAASKSAKGATTVQADVETKETAENARERRRGGFFLFRRSRRAPIAAANATAASTNEQSRRDTGAPDKPTIPQTEKVDAAAIDTGDTPPPITNRQEKGAHGSESKGLAAEVRQAEPEDIAARETVAASKKRRGPGSSLFKRSPRSAVVAENAAATETEVANQAAPQEPEHQGTSIEAEETRLQQTPISEAESATNDAATQPGQAAAATVGKAHEHTARATQNNTRKGKKRKKSANDAVSYRAVRRSAETPAPTPEATEEEPLRRAPTRSAAEQTASEETNETSPPNPTHRTKPSSKWESIIDLQTAPEKPQKRRTFFSRLLTRHLRIARPERDTAPLATVLHDAAQSLEEAARSAEALSLEPPPPLMEKLSGLETVPDDEAQDTETDAALAEPEDDPELEERADGQDGGGELPEEPGPLTLSILELQAKMEPKAPQIRSFPWLRG